jgi:hypothetical protein
MLQNGLGFVLLDGFGHHIQYVMHYSSAQLQVVMRFHPLFGNSLRNTFAVTALELTGKKISKPKIYKKIV